ncbi:MAG: carbonic anhydrase [Myxococcales bacterium]|nr:carbonic anhydrase [Myxococcales bacterium]
MPRTWDPDSVPPESALQRLLLGNARFRSGQGRIATLRPDLAEVVQRPFAIVVGCSDSRTPVEILFDQGFGDLFVVRVAGNVASPAVLGSVEFAASQFGSRLVLVLGHTRCGAVTATLDAVESGYSPASSHIAMITDLIAPTVIPLFVGPGALPKSERPRAALRANAVAAAKALTHRSALLAELVDTGRLAIVSAEYALETGEVTIIDDGGLLGGERDLEP